MFIRPMSDLHLEHGNPFLPPEMDGDAETVLVLAGDIFNGTKAVPWIQALASRFKHVIYVLGNHDYWGEHLDDLPGQVKAALADAPNISFLHNESVVVDGVRFLGGTLWTDFNREDPKSLAFAPKFMWDYAKTKAGGGYRNMTPYHVLAEHKQTKAFLIEKFKEEFAGPTVVITHHGPSPESVHPRYYYAKGNEYYFSDLEELLYLYQPKYWLHGHTHESLDYVIDQTRVVVNPFGYHGYEVNENFKPDLRLEI